MSPRPFTIAIAGNPNCGKTALFNALTGSRQHVGNWPGVTVEKKEGFFDLGSRHIRVVDLPGTYAIFANAEDERAAVDFILAREANLIVNIVDATNLERNMFLTSQLVDMQQPMVIAVNMMDIAEQRGLHIDTEALSKRFGVPVIPLSAVSTKSVTNFISQMAHVISGDLAVPTRITYGDKVEAVVKELEPNVSAVAKLLDAEARWVSLMYLGNEKSYSDKFAEAGVQLNKAEIESKLGEESEFVMADARYSFAHDVASEVIVGARSKRTFSDKLDSVLLNRFASLPIFLLIMYLVFWIAVTVGSAFIDFFDISFGAVFVDGLGYLLSDVLHAPAIVSAFLADGVGSGIQTVSTFIPVVFFMFICLTFLEDSGYMARAAFVADRFMRFLGLPGRAFVPMMVGFGCGVPAIMGSRVLESKRERFLTIFLVPFMSCGARLPVYALFAAAFFGAQAGTVVFALYLAGVIFAILYGLILRRSLFVGEASNFVMELPPYHLPKFKSLMIHAWLKLKDYVWRAGKVITIAVMVLGVLNSVGFVDGKFSAGNADSENSLLSSIGKTITPVFEPFGVEKNNWPASVSLFTGLLAKEAVVGTMNSLYSMAGDKNAEAADASEESHAPDLKSAIVEAFASIPANLGDVIGSLADPLGVSGEMETQEEEMSSNSGVYENLRSYFHNPDKDGNPVGGFNWQVFAFLIFVLLYVPCMAAMGVVVREIGLGLGVLMATVQTIIAWSVAILIYQIPVGGNTTWIVVSIVALIATFAFLKLFGRKANKQKRFAD